MRVSGPARSASTSRPSVPIPDPSDLPEADLAQRVAAAADLCRKPLRHAVLAATDPTKPDAPSLEQMAELQDCCLKLEVRSPAGERLPEEDLELELYRSGDDLHLTLAWAADPELPMLWQGRHPVWMSSNGSRCERPGAGLPLEALARRLRALLRPEPPAPDLLKPDR